MRTERARNEGCGVSVVSGAIRPMPILDFPILRVSDGRKLNSPTPPKNLNNVKTSGVSRDLFNFLSTVPATSYEPVAFIQCLTSTASTSENAIFRIGLTNYTVSLTTNRLQNSKLLQIFALTSAMTSTTALASASLKIIWYGAPVSLLVHCCRHPHPVLRQNIRPRKGYEEGMGD